MGTSGALDDDVVWQCGSCWQGRRAERTRREKSTRGGLGQLASFVPVPVAILGHVG